MADRIPLIAYAYSLCDDRAMNAIRLSDYGNVATRRCSIKTVTLKHPNRSLLYWERRQFQVAK